MGKDIKIFDRPATGARSRRSSSSSSSKVPKTPVPPPGQRQRGRPPGKRQPLNAEQRRERNAQYERERRVEMSTAVNDLADAAGLPQDTPQATVLAMVLARFSHRQHDPPEDILDLRRINDTLTSQIAEASSRLGLRMEELLASDTDLDAADSDLEDIKASPSSEPEHQTSSPNSTASQSPEFKPSCSSSAGPSWSPDLIVSSTVPQEPLKLAWVSEEDSSPDQEFSPDFLLPTDQSFFTRTEWDWDSLIS